MRDKENPEFSDTSLFKNNTASSAANKLKRREDIEGTLMAISPFIGYILFGLFPMLLSLVVSFTDLKSFDITRLIFVGF